MTNKKNSLFLSLVATLLLFSSSARAEEHDSDMEKCKVVKDGKGMIKENMADGKGDLDSEVGLNKEGDPEAWIYVPKGECAKINNGDLSGISDEIKSKLKEGL